MKIICDTNLWYEFGHGKLTIDEVNHLPLSPTYCSIRELMITGNVAFKPELSQPSIKALFHFKSNKILDSPITYLMRLNGVSNLPLVPEDLKRLLVACEMIAKGGGIAENRKEDFMLYVKEQRKDIIEVSKWFAGEAKSISSQFQELELKKERKKKDTIDINKAFLSYLVKLYSNNSSNLDEFDFNKIELLLKTLDYFFKSLEVDERAFSWKDWYDLFNMVYVQPGDLYWTREGRWKTLATEAGMGKYLFEKVDGTFQDV